MKRHRTPLARYLLVSSATAWLCACSVYDPLELVRPITAQPRDAGTDGMMPNPGDGGNDGALSCVPQAEVCNGLDDNCDGKVDEAAAASADCATRRPHATRPMCAAGTCFSNGCEDGYGNLDGEHSNGCEPLCESPPCDDAGADDGGV